MDVLHLLAGNLFGGVESMLVTVAKERDRAPRMVPAFGLCFDGRLRADLDALGVPVEHLGGVRFRYPWTIVRARRSLARWLARKHFHVGVCHAPWLHALFGPVLRRHRVPVAFFQHDVATGRHWVERLAKRTPPDLIVANSRFTSESSRHLFGQVAVAVQAPPVMPPASVSAEDRTRKRRELELRDEDVVIVQASRLQPWKGQTRLLRALASLRHRTNWVLLQVGGAQRSEELAYLGEVQRLTRELGIAEHVRFLGQRTDVPGLLQAADIHCQPNLSPEPFGIAFVEALYAGLPVVTMDLGGAREIVTPETGFLVRSESELSRVLERLIDDAPLRQKLGAAGPARAHALCSPDTQLPHFEQVLRRIARK